MSQHLIVQSLTRLLCFSSIADCLVVEWRHIWQCCVTWYVCTDLAILFASKVSEMYQNIALYINKDYYYQSYYENMALHEKVHAERRWLGHTSSHPGPKDMCMDEIWLFWVLPLRLSGVASWFWNMNHGGFYCLHSSVANSNIGCDGHFWIVLCFSLLAWMMVCFSSQSQDSLCCMFFSVQVQRRSLFLTLEAEVWNFSHCWE